MSIDPVLRNSINRLRANDIERTTQQLILLELHSALRTLAIDHQRKSKLYADGIADLTIKNKIVLSNDSIITNYNASLLSLTKRAIR